MELQKLYSKVRQAVDAYQMIEDGDKIAIGISGGKDSLTLLYALAGMRKFYPKKYDVVAITVDTGVGNMDFSKVKELCESLNVPYEIISDVDISDLDGAAGEADVSALCEVAEGRI